MVSIKSYNVSERVQADLIDMRSQPDGQFKCILHLKDHFSKLTLENKTAQDVCDGIAFCIIVFGPMRILQMDNAAEFKGVLYTFFVAMRLRLSMAILVTPNHKAWSSKAMVLSDLSLPLGWNRMILNIGLLELLSLL